jgi:hypothetical protein
VKKISEKNEATAEEELLVNREKVQLRSTLLTTVEKQSQNSVRKHTLQASERAKQAKQEARSAGTRALAYPDKEDQPERSPLSPDKGGSAPIG